MYTDRDHAFMKLMASQAAARHRVPEAEFDHPKGVIVPYCELLTDNIRNDRNYVPYCGPCDPMQRLRRVADGFECPTCKKKSNWDMTPFNNNMDVKFDPQYADPEFVTEHERNVRLMRNHEEIHKETYADFKQRQEIQARVDWNEDRGKKNTADHDCMKCNVTFFGKRKRKYCRSCQGGVTLTIDGRTARAHRTPFYIGNRQERRHG